MSVLTPAEIAQRLDDRFRLLASGNRTAPSRHQSLQVALEWSHELLSAEERRLFACLSVFAGGCTLEAAEEVCEADLDMLQSLVEKSLLRFSNERYWLLETIREYARERLAENGYGGAYISDVAAEVFLLDGSMSASRLAS